MKPFLPLISILVACAPRPDTLDESPIVPTGPVEEYGFVTTLGNDTVAAERITRGADALVSESVDRWPFVKLRHTELALAPDGRLTRMVMDIRTPNAATPAERWRRVVARFDDDSVHVTVRDSAGVAGRSFATGGALTVPHVSMQYAVIEHEIATAMRLGSGDSLPFRQFYPDRDVGPRFVLHRGFVVPGDGGRVELHHDWLAGIGDVVMDGDGRMLSYSGRRTTYQVAVARTATPPDVAAIGTALVAAERQAGQQQLSVRDTTRATIGEASFEIDYGRPRARGRVLLGNVIPYDIVWRTGANAATRFTTSAPITLAGMEVPAGSYTLWTVPRRHGVDLVVNRETGQWGTEYHRAQDLGVAPMQVDSLTVPVEEFTISLVPDGDRRGTLVMEWGTFRWRAAITVRP